jgi:hypothetical protein
MCLKTNNYDMDKRYQLHVCTWTEIQALAISFVHYLCSSATRRQYLHALSYFASVVDQFSRAGPGWDQEWCAPSPRRDCQPLHQLAQHAHEAAQYKRAAAPSDMRR